MKDIRKSLLASGMSLVLCFALLLGTTYAWFTSSVTNNNNKITAGTLTLNGYAYSSADNAVEGGTTVNVDNEKYYFAKDGQNLRDDNKASINKSNFDPTKTYTKLYEVKNDGTLDFKYRFDFYNTVDGGLGDLIWFDFVPLNDDNSLSRVIDKTKHLNNLDSYLKNDKGEILKSKKAKKYLFIYGLDDAIKVENFNKYYLGNTFKFDIDIKSVQTNGEFEELPKDLIFNKDISNARELENMMHYIKNGNDVEVSIVSPVKLENTMTLQDGQTVKLKIAKDVLFDIPNQIKSPAGFENSNNNKCYVDKAAITVKKGSTLEITGQGILKSDDFYAINVEEGGTLKINGVVINASNGYKDGIYAIYSRGNLTVENVTIKAFTDNNIMSSTENPSPQGGSTAYGIYAAGGNLTVNNSRIEVSGATNGNTGNGANGIYVNGAADVIVKDTTITGTGEGDSQVGIYCFGGSIKLISNVNIGIKGTAVYTWKPIERIEKSTLNGSQYSIYNRSDSPIDITNDTVLTGNISGKINQVN